MVIAGANGLDFEALQQRIHPAASRIALLARETPAEFVAFDHLQGERFRHGATFLRWRHDKPPRECTFAQVDAMVPSELQAIFGL